MSFALENFFFRIHDGSPNNAGYGSPNHRRLLLLCRPRRRDPAAGPPRRMLGCSRSVKGNRNMIITSTDSKREPERNPYSGVHRMQSSGNNRISGWFGCMASQSEKGKNQRSEPSHAAIRWCGKWSTGSTSSWIAFSFRSWNTSERVIDPGDRVAIHDGTV